MSKNPWSPGTPQRTPKLPTTVRPEEVAAMNAVKNAQSAYDAAGKQSSGSEVIGLVEDLKKTGISTLPETNSSHLIFSLGATTFKVPFGGLDLFSGAFVVRFQGG